MSNERMLTHLEELPKVNVTAVVCVHAVKDLLDLLLGGTLSHRAESNVQLVHVDASYKHPYG